MKEGYLCKSTGGRPDGEEMKQVNRYTRRELKPQEVYTFSVVLCDNEIDRDYERFTIPALEALAELYVGKTGIFDHSMQSSGQTARIYACQVERQPERLTQAGEPYHRLVARAYLPCTEKNQALIAELDAGIKKEVSVGCAVGAVTCSVCGAPLRTQPCSHQKGQTYKGQLCHAVLSEPTDAYEWSFVAVPAQREAGVIKQYQPQPASAEALRKSLQAGEGLTLSAGQVQGLRAMVDQLEQQAADGRRYREELESQVLRLSALVQPELDQGVMQSLAGRMTTDELKAFQEAYRQKAQCLLPCEPQIPAKAQPEVGSNAPFQI